MKITKFDMFIKHMKEIIIFLIECLVSPIEYKMVIIGYLINCMIGFKNPLSRINLVLFWELMAEIEKDIISDILMNEKKREYIEKWWKQI